MKVLSIGNSFSQDAHRFLHAVAANEGVEIDCVNLYIGGCDLQRHWHNWCAAAPAYLYEHNSHLCPVPGTEENRHVSIQEALAEGPWDVITLQQASHDSGKPETFQPWLNELADAIRQSAPQAKLMFHETWAYDVGSPHPNFPDYHCDQEEMHRRLRACCQQAAADIGADLIPCGDVIQALRHTAEFDAVNGISLCRDAFHMSLTLGRYALAVVWFGALTGAIPQNDFVPPCSAEDDAPRRALIRQIAKQQLAL